MENFWISGRFVDDSAHDDMFGDCATGKELIHALISDDWGAPPIGFSIEAKADDGRRVSIWIPYDERGKVGVTIEPEE